MARRVVWSKSAQNDRTEILQFWVEKTQSTSYSKKMDSAFIAVYPLARASRSCSVLGSSMPFQSTLQVASVANCRYTQEEIFPNDNYGTSTMPSHSGNHKMKLFT
jgi:hypothetical protein